MDESVVTFSVLSALCTALIGIVQAFDIKKRGLKITLLILLFGGFIFSVFQIVSSLRVYVIEARQHEQEFMDTQSKFEKTISELRLISDTLEVLRDSVNSQINLQKQQESISRELLSKNQSLLKEQQNLFDNTNRILTSSSDFSMTIRIEFPFDCPRLAYLKKYIFDVKRQIDSDPTKLPEGISFNYDRIGKPLKAPYEDLPFFGLEKFPEDPNDVLGFSSIIPNFDIYFYKSDSKGFQGFGKAFQKVSLVENSNIKPYYSVEADLERQVIEIFYRCYSATFSETYVNAKNFGRSDLLNSNLFFEAKGKCTDYKVTSFVLRDHLRYPLYMKVNISEKDAHYGVGYNGRKVYIHRMTKRDFDEEVLPNPIFPPDWGPPVLVPWNDSTKERH